jgi:diketogulonate reductase-like aldo/keto reductase
LDAGITHFDVARLYGAGEAERDLGSFVRTVRDTVTVTTKVGLIPSGGLNRYRIVRVARRAGGRSASSRRSFDVADVRRSVETSLRTLRLGHVDVLLLHECRPEEVTDELIAFLDDCVQRGLARATGVATGVAETAALVEPRQRFPSVVQVPFSVLAREPLPFPASIVHSVLAHDLHRVTSGLLRSRRDLASWSALVGLDCSDVDALARFLLACALDSSENGVVLFSSRRPARVRFDAALVSADLGKRERQAALDVLRDELSESP